MFIAGQDRDGLAKAIEWIEGLTKVVQAGEEYDGTVTRLMNFGAFVEILPGKEGLVHVSKMSTGFVKDPGEVVKVGDSVHVRVREIDDMGRINLTMLTEEEEQQARQNRPPQGGGQGRDNRRDNHRFKPRRQFNDRRRG